MQYFKKRPIDKADMELKILHSAKNKNSTLLLIYADFWKDESFFLSDYTAIVGMPPNKVFDTIKKILKNLIYISTFSVLEERECLGMQKSLLVVYKVLTLSIPTEPKPVA